MLRFGLVTDIQYADKDPWETRRFREVLGPLERCLEAFRGDEELAFIAQLGDLIDGDRERQGDLEDLEVVLGRLETLPQRLVHVIGNHCLSLPRSVLLPRLGLNRAYQRVLRQDGWRILALDTMDVSLCGRDTGSEAYRAAGRALAEAEARGESSAQPWNGTLGPAQIAWLEHELGRAEREEERVVCLAHLPIHPAAARERHLMWDHERLLEILSRHPSVTHWICGHDHQGGYAFDRGVHHLTLAGLVDQAPDGAAWAIAEADAEGLRLRGTGAVADALYPCGRAA